MDDDLFQLLIRLMQSIGNRRNENIQQTWIDLAVLKCNLRNGLIYFERNLSDLPPRERHKVLNNYFKVKDMLWKAVGALHGNISTVSNLVV